MKTIKRAGIAAAIMAGIGILVGVFVLTRDVVFERDESGKRKISLHKVKAKDQLFAFAGRDIKHLEITVREVDYSEDEDSSDDESEATEDASGKKKAESASNKQQKEVEERVLAVARVGDDWVLTKPVHALAAKGEAEGLATAVADMRVRNRYTDVDPFDPQYGLNNPCVIAKIWTKKGKEVEVLIGKDTPIDSLVYLTVRGSNTLYTATSSVKTSLIKKPKELREKKVTEFKEDDVKRVILDHGGKRIVCEQEGTKEAKDWWLTKPVRARADKFAVDDLIRDIKDIEAKEFVDDVKSLSTVGLDKPQVVARIDFGKGKKDVIVMLGKKIKKKLEDDDSYSSESESEDELKDLVYCMTRGRDEVFLVDAEIIDKLAKEAIDLRDKDIVDFQNSDVKKIVIKRKKGPTFELRESDGKWSIEKPEFAKADDMKVDDLLWDLKDIQASDFLEDKDISLARAGLVNPTISVTLTLEGKERPLIISFGYKEKGGTRYYCKTNEMKKPVLIDDTFLDAIPKKIEDLKEEESDTESDTESDSDEE